MNSSEQNLWITQTKAGDHKAFEKLVTLFSPLVFTMIYRRLNHRENAEEVAQDVFLRAYKYLGSYKGQSKFSTWLCTIANNATTTFLQKKNINLEELLPESHKLASVNQHTLIEKEEQSTSIANAISSLGHDEKQVITLYYQGEQSIREIAAILNIEENNVKIKLHRARKKLHERLVNNKTMQYEY